MEMVDFCGVLIRPLGITDSNQEATYENHKKYGNKWNTKEQLEEFQKSRGN